MEHIYIDPKTNQMIVLDDTDPQFQKKRTNLESRGFEYTRTDSYNPTIMGQGGIEKRLPPIQKNIPTDPGASYSEPPVARPERPLSGESDILKMFREQQQAPVTPSATATPAPTPKAPVTPTATPAPLPTAKPTAAPVAPAPTRAPATEGVVVPRPAQPTAASVPTVPPISLPQQGNMGDARPKTGRQMDGAPDLSLITPVPGQWQGDPRMNALPEAQPVQLGEQLTDPTLTPKEPDQFEALKDPTEALAETATRMRQGDVTPESLGLDTSAMQNAGINPKTVPQKTAPGQAAPIGAIDSLQSKSPGGTKTLNAPGQAEGIIEQDLGGMSDQQPVPKSPFTEGSATPAPVPGASAAPFDPRRQQPTEFEGGIPPPSIRSAQPKGGSFNNFGEWKQPTEFEGGIPPIDSAAPVTQPAKPLSLDTSAMENFGVNERTVGSGQTDGGAPAMGGGEPGSPSGASGGGSGAGGVSGARQGGLSIPSDTSNLKGLNTSAKTQSTSYDEVDKQALRERMGAAQNADLGLGDLERRLSQADQDRFDRTAELAKSRGVALENYMAGLDRNERKAFISTIVDSIGKILVGGFDLAGGPKTSSISQFYKGVTPYDKKGADALEQQKYGAVLKKIDDDESSIQEAEASWMKNKEMIENMRGRINNDLFRMALENLNLSKVLIDQGYTADYLTDGFWKLMDQTQNNAVAMEKLKAANELQLQIIRDAAANSRSATQAKIAADAVKRTQTQTQDKEKTENKKDVKVRQYDQKEMESTKKGFADAGADHATIRSKAKALPSEWNRYNNTVMPAWENFKKNPEDPAARKAYLDAIEEGNRQLIAMSRYPALAKDFEKKRDAMASQWNRYHTRARIDPNHPYFQYGPIDAFDMMGQYAIEQANKALNDQESMYTPGGTDTKEVGEGTKEGEERRVNEAGMVDRPQPALPAEQATPSGEGAASSSEPPTPTPVGTPTAQPGVIAPRPKVTPAVPATPVKPVVPTAPAPVPAPQAKATPPTPIDGKLEARLRELKQVTKRGNLSSEQRAEVAEYLKDPNVKHIWDTMSVPSARPATPAPTAAPVTAKSSITPEQAQAEIAKLAAKVRGGAKLSKEEGARVQELKKILGK